MKTLETKRFDLSGILTPDLLKISEIFKSNGFEIKIAGGAVRDLVLGVTPKDIDLATDAFPEQMLSMLDQFTTIPTGLHHGTITVVGSDHYEITTLRVDLNPNGRHSEVQWTRDFEQDAARRDIRYNAMFFDFDGKLYDFFGGQNDLQAGRTRMVGDPGERFREDFLRILRLFRFVARFGHNLDQPTINAVTEHRSGLESISGERIWSEIQKILVGPDPRNVLDIMALTGISDVIGLPKMNGWDSFGRVNQLARELEDPILVLGLITNPDQADWIIDRWKFSSSEQRRLRFISSKKVSNDDLRDIKQDILLSKDPGAMKMMFTDVLRVQGREGLDSWDYPEFPIRGQDLIDGGMQPGPLLGQRLMDLKKKWLNEVLD